MPSDYELSTGPGDEQGIAVGEFTLADGTVSLILPKHWALQREEFRQASFAIPGLRDATLSIEIKLYDDPAAIAANDLSGYINDPAFPALADDALDHVRDAKGAPDFEKLTVRARGTTRGPDGAGDHHEAVRIWRKLGLHRPNLIRVLEAQLSVAEDEAVSAAAQEAEDIIDHLLKFVRFADHETAADRIAPSETLKSITLWDTVYLRVLPDARGKRENPDGTGMYVYDHEVDDRWTLWIDYDVFKTGTEPVDVNEIAAGLVGHIDEKLPKRREVIATSFDPMPDRPDEAMGTTVFSSVEKGDALRHTVWHKVVHQGHYLIFGHFTWVVVEARRDEPDMQALTETIEQEVRNAVLFYGGPLHPPPAGNA